MNTYATSYTPAGLPSLPPWPLAGTSPSPPPGVAAVSLS